MAKTKKEKETILKKLTEAIKNAKLVLFTNYVGLRVKETGKLRCLLQEKGCQYKVVKKTLIKLALEEAGLKDFEIEKIGMANGLVLAQDEIEPIKAIFEFSKENPQLEIQAGLFEGKSLSKEEIEFISKIPSREQLLSQVVYAVKSPLIRLLNSLQFNQRKFVYLLASIYPVK